jgi:hypothetical protein
MVGYPSDVPGYRVYILVKHNITTSVHFMFHETVPGFKASPKTDNLISGVASAADGSDQFFFRAPMLFRQMPRTMGTGLP